MQHWAYTQALHNLVSQLALAYFPQSQFGLTLALKIEEVAIQVFTEELIICLISGSA